MNHSPAHAGTSSLTFSLQPGGEVFLCPKSEVNPVSWSFSI